ncbi:MAG TPA: type II toxin-antitoxin system ParD family antitoxin [Planctomycetota bacterium]|nr:type II toxin-antitoxin system ParD family antitoxin [Planctomycetota bacterium]
MIISLPPELDEFVKSKVANGQFPSADDAVQEAVRLLMEQDDEQQRKCEALKRDIAKGIEDIEQGRVYPVETEKMLAELRAARKTRANH